MFRPLKVQWSLSQCSEWERWSYQFKFIETCRSRLVFFSHLLCISSFALLHTNSSQWLVKYFKITNVSFVIVSVPTATCNLSSLYSAWALFFTHIGKINSGSPWSIVVIRLTFQPNSKGRAFRTPAQAVNAIFLSLWGRYIFAVKHTFVLISKHIEKAQMVAILQRVFHVLRYATERSHRQ